MTDPLSEASIRRLVREEVNKMADEIRRAIPKLSQREVEQRRKAGQNSIEKRRVAAIARWHGDRQPAKVSGTGRERRYARMRLAKERGTHSTVEWGALVSVFDGACVRCGGKPKTLCRDHVIPIYLDGSDAIDNIQPLCKRCNASKMIDSEDYRVRRRPDWKAALTAAVHTAKSAKESAKESAKNQLNNNKKEDSADSILPKRSVRKSAKKAGSQPTEESSAPSARTWLAYASAYKLRYGTFPVRNAKVNGLLAHFIRRIPQEEAPRVAEFYLKHEGKLYVSSAHCVELMLRDSEKLRMEWATGRRANGVDVAVGRSWWETWSGIQQKGSALHVEPDEQPQIYKAKVLKAAAASGDLPREIAEKLGVSG